MLIRVSGASMEEVCCEARCIIGCGFVVGGDFGLGIDFLRALSIVKSRDMWGSRRDGCRGYVVDRGRRLQKVLHPVLICQHAERAICRANHRSEFILHKVEEHGNIGSSLDPSIVVSGWRARRFGGRFGINALLNWRRERGRAARDL